MDQIENLTRSDADTIAWELHRRTPDNQLDVWQRLFYGLHVVLRDSHPSLAQPICEMNLALYRLRRLPCPGEQLSIPVTPKEAWALASLGIALGKDSFQRLQALLHACTTALMNQSAVSPLLNLWDAIEEQAYRANRTRPIDDQPEPEE